MKEHPVTPKKIADLNNKMAQLGIKPKDIEEKAILGSGKGGQKVNKSATCIWIKHIPSGVIAKSQKTRSKEVNRFLAKRQLCEKVERDLFGHKTKEDLKNEKIRKQKKRRTRRQIKKEDD